MSSLRSGITTGTCASAAAGAAACVLVGIAAPKQIEVRLPSGNRLFVPVLYAKRESDETAVAAVRKDAGDDPDVTDGMEVVVRISWADSDETTFVAGDGVGTVTKPGLQIPPGEPAINPVPRAMIIDAVREVTDRPVVVEVSIPGGCEVAMKTFNPRLGISGGLSVLGTSGIVRPYCRRAIEDAIRAAMDVAAACGVVAPVLVPGNIGAKAASLHFNLAEEQVIEVGNDWGFALDEFVARRFQGVMLLGHPGKIAKLIAGQWDTHSSRSAQAVSLVAEIADESRMKLTSPCETVEGIFTSLEPATRRRLGNEIARRVREAVDHRIEGLVPVSVFLVDMQGRCLGDCGEFSQWK